MGVLARRGAACIFNPYHPAEDAEGLGNGIIWSQGEIVGPNTPMESLKWGDFYYVPLNKYPKYSWWVGDNESSGKTDGAWFPQGSGNRVSKKKGEGSLFIYFVLNTTGVGNAFGDAYAGWQNYFPGAITFGFLGSKVPYNYPYIYPPINPPFNSGTEFKSISSAKRLIFNGTDDSQIITHTIRTDGGYDIDTETISFPSGYDPTVDGWKPWYENNFYKENGGLIGSEYFPENTGFGLPRPYYNPLIVPRDDEADNYPEFDISSTDLTQEDKIQYGVFAPFGSSDDPLNQSKFLCWNTPVSDFSWRKDYKTMNLKLSAFRAYEGCDTGCSYGGKKFKFKLTYQEGDMSIALNGSNSYTGTPFFVTKSDITWGEIKTIDITVDPLKLSDWDSITTPNEKEVWTQEWDGEEIGRGKARRLIDFYLESIEDE
jgi:hypothetical protein